MKEILEQINTKNLLILILLIVFIIVVVIIVLRRRNDTKRELEKSKVKIDKDLILKEDGRIREIAYQIYSALKGPGTNDELLDGLIPSLTKEERKAVANEFANILIEKGETEDGNIVNWLEDDGRSDLAQKFIAVGIKPVKT